MPPITPPPPPKLPNVAHGTLSGYLMEIAAKVKPCQCCQAALDAEIAWCREHGLNPARIFPQSSAP